MTDTKNAQTDDTAQVTHVALGTAALAFLAAGLTELAPVLGARIMQGLERRELRVEITLSLPGGEAGAFLIDANGRRRPLFALAAAASAAPN